ncbi:Crp/Fnr family transcriptional regulator [Chryseobacterium indologenes]|uniref:Crp/Fnr family transcriptional regulator n=1 Tax=Chryseobacterium indologenes TaxID=253 RepID=UPI003D347447
MLISEEMLLAYGATYENYNPQDMIFTEGSMPKFYFQIVTGTVELNNYREDGKEFIQNIISDGQSIGESILFVKQPYPMNAQAASSCTILRLPESDFFSLLEQNTEVLHKTFQLLSERLYYKYTMLFSVSSNDPAIKIKSLFDYLKLTKGSKEESFVIPYTRQQIANLTGLRVETVIRTIKKMQQENIVKIDNRKIIY